MASVLVKVDDGRCGLIFVGLALLLEVKDGGAGGDIIVVGCLYVL